MKIRIEIEDALQEIEVTIKAPKLNKDVHLIQEKLYEIPNTHSIISLYDEDTIYFVDIKDILFFETDETKVYAHTKTSFYSTKEKLYQLESLLPSTFTRVSKSAIVNCHQVYGVTKSFSGSVVVQFYESTKKLHVSRHYSKLFLEKLKEVR